MARKPKPVEVVEEVVEPTPPELPVVEDAPQVVAGADEPALEVPEDEPFVAEETAEPEAPVEDVPPSPVEVAVAFLSGCAPGKHAVKGGEKMAAALRALGWDVARVVPDWRPVNTWDVIVRVP